MPTLLNEASLPNTLASIATKSDKVICVLGTFENPPSVSDLQQRAFDAGWREAKKTNFHSLLKNRHQHVMHTKKGWVMTAEGREYLESKGLTLDASPIIDTASDLRALLTEVSDSNTVRFLEEAIGCCEAKLYRSAVVMSWLAAIHVMQSLIHKHYLSAFNAEMKSAHANWKDVKVLGDFSRIKESEFLLRLGKISVLDGSQKKLLEECLDRRNQCGHPNSFKIHENTVRHHIEVLILNIFQPFSK